MKGVTQIASIRDVKNARSAGARCIPKVHRSSYLELYVLRREKDRVEKELTAIDKRRNSVGRRLEDIYRQIEQLQKEINAEDSARVKATGKTSAKPMKKMAISY